MADENHLRVIRSGVEGIKQWRKENPNEVLRLNGADLTGLYLADANLARADFSEAKLTDIEFTKANLECAKFKNATLVGCDLTGARCTHSDFIKASFTNVRALSADFQLAAMECSYFEQCDFSATRFDNASLSGAVFTQSKLRFTDLSGALLREVRFDECDLKGTKFLNADLSSATFIANQMDTQTSFASAHDVRGCKMTRLMLLTLANFGGLTPGQRATMNISDDVGKLRREFSGYMFWLHAACLLVFTIPYARFLATKGVYAHFRRAGGDSITLLEALWNFIFSGGRAWKTTELHLFSFTCFCVFVFYNILRVSLLWKTKQLESIEDTTSAPAEFSFSDSRFWRIVYRAVRILTWLAGLSVLYHTYNFLTMRIPLDQHQLFSW